MHYASRIVTFAAAGIFAVAAAHTHPAAAQSVPSIPGLPQAARSAAASIDAEKMRAHVRFLSLDLLEGRGPGTRGDKLSAEYIATQFALSGVEPAGENGTYFQRVPLIAVHTIEDKTKFQFVPATGQPIDLDYGTEIVSKDQSGQTNADLDAPIVFVGYGIHVPEYKWDDYAGVDLKGKIALVIVNEPPSADAKSFKGKALTHYGRWTYKYEEAARRGRCAHHPPYGSGELRVGSGPQLPSHREELSAGRSPCDPPRRRMDSAWRGPTPDHARRSWRP